MDETPHIPSGGMPYGHLEELLKQNLEVGKENHKILKRMERNALISFTVKILIWLLVLGVPIFFLSTYLAPLMNLVQHGASGTTTPAGIFGLPSAEQIQLIIERYKAGQ